MEKLGYYCAALSCDCTHPTPFFRRALLPLTCPLGNLPPFTKKTFTPNKSMQIATINKVISIVSSISINFVGANIGLCKDYATVFT